MDEQQQQQTETKPRKTSKSKPVATLFSVPAPAAPTPVNKAPTKKQVLLEALKEASKNVALLGGVHRQAEKELRAFVKEANASHKRLIRTEQKAHKAWGKALAERERVRAKLNGAP